MHLNFAGAPEIRTTRAAVWRHLLDPHFIAACLPAVESVTVIEPTRFRIVSGFGVGFVRLDFTVFVELHDLVEPESARLRMHGTAPGTTVEMESRIAIEDAGAERVRLRWEAASTVHGTAAAVGRRIMEGAARRLTAMFWEEFAKRAEAQRPR
jgi:uncharacterized protein